jgi:hypothetical protein
MKVGRIMPLKKHEQHVLKFLLAHMFYGASGGFLFGVLLLWQDISGIYSLAMHSENPILIIGLLFFGLFVTFGSAGMGVGIMSLGEDQN